MKLSQALLKHCGQYLSETQVLCEKKFKYLCFIFIIQIGISLRHISSSHAAVNVIKIHLLLPPHLCQVLSMLDPPCGRNSFLPFAAIEKKSKPSPPDFSTGNGS